MEVCVVTNLSKKKISYTGIGRYADELKKNLELENKVLYAEDFMASSPVFQTFPLRIPFQQYSFNTIFHLTCQTFTIPLLWQKPKQPVIVTVHDIIPAVTRTYHSVADRILTYASLQGLKRATHIIADSEQTKKDVIAYLKIPKEKITVIPLGIDHDVFYPSATKKEKNTILYVGSEQERKNLPRLIHAVAEIKKKIPSILLVKVGLAQDKHQHAVLIELVKNLGLEKNVIWKGYVENVSEEYRKASVCVFPSLYEGFGFPVLEAMACGCPVICSDKTSFPELAGSAAVYFDGYNHNDLASKIITIISDSKVQQLLRKKGVMQSKKFTWKKCAEQTKKVYASVEKQYFSHNSSEERR